MKRFCLGGPVDPECHYMISPLARLPRALPLAEAGSYFVIHGPRQSGKTTVLQTLADHLNGTGRFSALVVSCEIADSRIDDFSEAETERRLLEDWRRQSIYRLPPDSTFPAMDHSLGSGLRIISTIEQWARQCPRPTVLLIDEIDCLPPAGFLSLLRQLRRGAPFRPKGFPASIVLTGLRDVRDYSVASGGSGTTGSGSPFNVSVASFIPPNFTRSDIAALFGQHTADGGRAFATDSIDLVFEQTAGQPWLVNAVGEAAVRLAVSEAMKPITASDVAAAIREIETSGAMHFSSLAERLKEPRVLQVVAPAIIGGSMQGVSEDDQRYVCDLGILARSEDGTLRSACPIYGRVLTRLLTESIRANVGPLSPVWIDSNGRLDLVQLREAFLSFWRVHRDLLKGQLSVPEVAPHLILMAWLDRVANGGGRVNREFAVGRGRLDLLLQYKGQQLPIEVKVHRDGRADPLVTGLQQLDGYISQTGAETGWLVIFDQRSNAAEDALASSQEQTPDGRLVTVIRA